MEHLFPYYTSLGRYKGYIKGYIRDWIISFLTNRRQCVKVNGVVSDWAEVISSIPQGTVLGPLLFLIHIGDIGIEDLLTKEGSANDPKVL